MADVNARILLWGLEGSGKTTTLETIHAKLREDLRGDLRREATRLDPTVFFESLSITLGEVGGVGTQLELIAVPGASNQVMTRKQLLDEVDGIVLVLDCSPGRIEDNFESIAELRASLEAYGRTLDTFPVVLQYNKRDIADPFAIEDLHRRISLEQCAVFESIATTGHGILPTLTTISKHVVRARRGASQEIDPAVAAAAAAVGAAIPAAPIDPPSPPTEALATPAEDLEVPELTPLEMGEVLGDPIEGELADEMLEAVSIAEDEPDASVLEAEAFEAISTAELFESAILAEGEQEDFQTLGAIEIDLANDDMDVWSATDEQVEKPTNSLGELRIVSAGRATVEADGGVRLPLVLGDESGASRSVVLSLRLDSLIASDVSDAGSDD
jgi:signal recognition particle receptor subunit beta